MDPGTVYTLARGEHQYGPFTVEQLRHHYVQGSFQPTDLVWCQGMTTWIPVGEVLGSDGPPGVPTRSDPETPNAPPPAPVSRSQDLEYPRPPSMHWALVLLCTVLTFGIFGIVWMFVHAMWVRQIEPTTNALFILIVGIPLQILLGLDGYEFLAALVGGVATTWAYFSMRSAIEARFGVALSGIMTFFFNLFYLQYHMTDIAEGGLANAAGVRIPSPARNL